MARTGASYSQQVESMRHLFEFWYMPYWVTFAVLVLFVSFFVEGRPPTERWWKRIAASILLTGMCALIFWTTWKEQDLTIAEDLQVVAAERHIPTPNLWWRMH